MKNLLNQMTKSIAVGFIFCTSNLFAATSIKVPHSHQADHGGQVLMFGDDHLEIVGDVNGGMATIYVSDKMREVVPLDAVKLNVEIVNGTDATPLKVISSAKASNIGLVKVPTAMQKSGVLKVQLIRISPPKGHLTISTAQTLPLSKVFQP